MKKIGIILTLVGLLLTFYAGLNYITRDRFVRPGKIEKITDNSKTENWQPYIGIAAIIIGSIVLVLAANRKDEKDIFKK